MVKIIAGLVLGFLMGLGCRSVDVPVPNPPRLVGVLLVVAMTLDYLSTDAFLARNIHVFGERQATTVRYCRGPTRETAVQRHARQKSMIKST
jgi:XapX domain-containing protein